MQLRIRSIAYLAEDINGYELVDPNGRDLPRFAAGAHVGVRLGPADFGEVWRAAGAGETARVAAARVREPQPGPHLYYCARAGMMAAAAAASAHWPPGTVHCEYFSGPAAAPPARLQEERPFRVRLARSGGE